MYRDIVTQPALKLKQVCYILVIAYGKSLS